MIHQDAPRKKLRGCVYSEDKGFWLEGKDRQDCFNQLKEFGEAHPEKWIYYYDCGLGPSWPVPVAMHLFEVTLYDAQPASRIMFSRLFQRGCEGRREIDSMSEEERTELTRRQLSAISFLSKSFNLD